MSSILTRKFSEMSAARDQPEECETEGNGYVTSEGYVHEVVSKSPARVSVDGGMKQTITKRVSVTKGEVVGQTAPRLVYGASPKLDVLPSASPSGPPSRSVSAGQESVMSSTRHSYSGVAGGAPMTSRPLSPTFVKQQSWQQQQQQDQVIFSPPPAAPPGAIPPQQGYSQQQFSSRSSAEGGFESPSGNRQQQAQGLARGVGPMEWARTSRRSETSYNEQGREGSGSRGGIAPKSVTIGGIDLREVEPSRLSPLHVHDVYAPIRYVSKRELRAMREKAVASNSAGFTDRIRHSSVPRLDAMAEQRLHSGRAFAADADDASSFPPHSERSISAGRYSQHSDHDEVMFRSQAPLVYANMQQQQQQQQQQRVQGSQPTLRYIPSEYPQSGSASQMGDDDTRSLSNAGGSYYYDELPRSGSGYGSDYGRRSSQPAAQRYYQPQPPTTVHDLSSSIDLETFTQYLAFARGIATMPAPPQFCREAFLLLQRGTYLVKYGRTGNPHERYLALRLVRDDRTKRVFPYLVWALHQDAVSFKERIPLVHLMHAQAGVSGCHGFQRHMIDQTSISGPIVSGKRSVLPTTYAFSWTFESISQTRTVECLALDQETFRCWMLVGQYFAAVNSGSALVEEAETLAPDTPRSTVSGSVA